MNKDISVKVFIQKDCDGPSGHNLEKMFCFMILYSSSFSSLSLSSKIYLHSLETLKFPLSLPRQSQMF